MTKIDYKSTLNLPKTDFAMRANLPQKEPETLKKWQDLHLYEAVREKNKGKKKFILHMGPPYANGDIHIGHALTTILKDIIIKSKGLSGYDSPLVPGWDCHGLPIELNVEKKIGLANVDVTPKAFREACREYANSQIALQKASFKRLGILGDWEHPYLTMDYRYEANIVRALGKILARGYLHQGAKPVHWCVNCGSSLAEAEVEYQNKTSPAIDVNFMVEDSVAFWKAIGKNETLNVGFAVWTTTPWTLPANQAVALNPELTYVVVKTHLGAICVLEALLEPTMARYECADYEVMATFQGKQVEHLLLQHPFYEKKVPLVLGEHVTIDAGTGAVHTAPGHGLEDYQVGLHYHLPIETPVAGNGCFYPNVPLVGGLFVLKANDKIIEILKEKNTLLHATTVSHSYPHCWRHKTPLIFRATPQWFISMDSHDLRNETLKAVDTVKWVPQWGQSRMRLMIEGRPDWCISRQRTWGVPLPLFTHQETGELHPQNGEIIEYVATLIEKNGVDAWFDLSATDLPFNVENYNKSSDILDVWFDSGVSHTCVLQVRDDLQFPADLYLEGSDQHRGWFQTSLLSSMAMYDIPPFKEVLTHGFTVDAQGKKMSKSLGNVIAPEKVTKTLGADILRLWVSATDYKGEIHVSEEILTRMSDAYRRIRNTMRFLLANLDGYELKDEVKSSELLAIDAWIIDVVARLQDEIIQYYESYQFHNIYQKIHNLCVVELGSFYLDVIKDRQYTMKTDSLARRSAQTAMFYIAHALTRWLAPILSFTAEELWQYLPGVKEKSVFLSEWMTAIPRLSAASSMGDAYWQKIMQVRTQVNKALETQRALGKIGAPLDASVTLYAKDSLYHELAQLQDELRFVLITSGASVKNFNEAAIQNAQSTEMEDLWVEVQVSGGEKCERCWHHRIDVSQNENYPGICARCVVNIDSENGEERHYV